MTPHLVRQPIVDRDQNVYGYQLLCAGGIGEMLCRVDGATETTTKSAHSHDLEGLQKLTGGRKCFLSFDRKLLIDQAYRALSAKSTVIEIPRTERVDSELVNACQKLRCRGYALALEDFVVEPQSQPLLEHIDLLKVEFSSLSDDQHCNIVQSAGRYGFAAVAEQVDTQEDFLRARQLGYSYFQGYFYCRPADNSLKQMPASRLQCLRLLKVVSEPLFQFDQVEELVRQDLSLTVRLLKYLNSPSIGLRIKVNSIRQAVGILGQRPLQKWVSVIAVSELSRDKPLVLMTTSLVRAKFCEAIAERAFASSIACNGFLVGMLSLLDAILDQPMSKLLIELPLSESVRAPLLRQESPLSLLMDLSQALEEGDWLWISAVAHQLNVSQDVVFGEYENAVLWAASVTAEMT